MEVRLWEKIIMVLFFSVCIVLLYYFIWFVYESYLKNEMGIFNLEKRKFEGIL